MQQIAELLGREVLRKRGNQGILMIFSTRKIGISEADLTKKFVRNSKAKKFVSLVIVDEEDIENLKTMGLSKMHMAFVRESGFLGRKNEKIYLPNNQGKVTLALVGKK